MPLKQEPLEVKCFRCQELFVVKYVRRSKDYSKKNNWEHWTSDERNHGLYLCDNCLWELYYSYKKEFRQLVTDKKKQSILRQYINEGTIEKKDKKTFLATKFYRN